MWGVPGLLNTTFRLVKKSTCKIGGAENFKSLKGPAIYGILCRANERVYVGQSRNPKKRVSDHLYNLVRGIHDNSRLQGAWNRYGCSSFEVLVLERLDEQCSTEELNLAEKRWMDRWPEQLFNILDVPGTIPEWGVHYSITTLDQGQQRKDEARLNWWLMDEQEKKEALGEVKLPHNNRTFLNEETKKRAAEKARANWTVEKRQSRGSTYTVVNPEGQTIEFTGLSVFAEQNGLSAKKFGEMLNGHRLSYKGWKLPGTEKIGAEARRKEKPVHPYQSYGREEAAKKKIVQTKLKKQGLSWLPTLVDPEGCHYSGILNLAEFCREHGLDRGAISQSIRFRRSQYLGWKIVYDNPVTDEFYG